MLAPPSASSSALDSQVLVLAFRSSQMAHHLLQQGTSAPHSQPGNNDMPEPCCEHKQVAEQTHDTNEGPAIPCSRRCRHVHIHNEWSLHPQERVAAVRKATDGTSGEASQVPDPCQAPGWCATAPDGGCAYPEGMLVMIRRGWSLATPTPITTPHLPGNRNPGGGHITQQQHHNRWASSITSNDEGSVPDSLPSVHHRLFNRRHTHVYPIVPCITGHGNPNEAAERKGHPARSCSQRGPPCRALTGGECHERGRIKKE